MAVGVIAELTSFATAFLVACGNDNPPAGVSGLPDTTTSVAPTVPTTVPSEAALAEDRNQLQTAQSVELLVASVYERFGGDLTDPELAAIDGLDTGQRGGPEPEAITLESFGRPIPED